MEQPYAYALGALAGVVALLAVLKLTASLVRRCLHFLGKDEQLRVEMLTETVVMNGPGIKFLNPLSFRSASKVSAVTLGNLDYVIIKDTITGKARVDRGPFLLFLGPYEAIGTRGTAVTLGQTEYLHIENQLTGAKTIVKGPAVWFPPNPDERATGGPRAALTLQEDEYVCLKDDATGQRMVKRGKTLVFLEPTWKILDGGRGGGVRKAWTLKAYEYVRLHDKITGKITVHRGEKIVFPGPDEEILGVDGDKLCAIDLKVDEYVKIEDQTSGEIRVVKGVQRVFLGPNEVALHGGKQKAVQIDKEHAALVRDTSTGQLCLHTKEQLFVPGPDEVIEKVQDLIKLADHEAMIVTDKDGHMAVHYGSPDQKVNDNPRAFFQPPYSEIVELWWSSGLRRLKRDLCITRFDCRPQYMWFEFDCRTSDNVELVLETTMFWEVVDLEKMIRRTGNLPGDVYNQARSQFIKHVARVTLKKFMDELHGISSTIHEQDKPFYDSRGIRIHSLDVTKYKCSEKRTSEVLQQIIEETTNRLNRLSQAESENEVKIFRMQGQIEQEKLNSGLLKIQQEHTTEEARVAGAAEAERVSAFMSGLSKDVPKLDDRISIWQVLRKTDALSVVSGGGGNLYYTPNDVDLSIRTEGAPK